MNRQELKQILSSKFEFEKWKELLRLMFPKVDFLTKAIPVDTGLAKSGGQVGTIRLDDGRSLGLFLFEVADNIIIARNRKGLRDIAIRYVDQDIIHGALVLYYSDNQPDYRLTFVSKQTVINEVGVIETKTTAPKRYTFLLGENEPCTTATNRLFELVDKKQKGSLFLTDVEEAFSVERLNKDFFNGYKDRYKKFLAYLDDDTKDNRDYVKKLLGRLVFLQFLQKKGWMGVPATNGRWENGDRNYLYNLVKHHNGNDHLLSDVLETLFFETLNEPRTDDIADPILGDNIKIPYLNGGLFDRDEIDKKDVDFPYAYFLELMEFFGMYNFTIDENDPDDAEIGVDPEMLGHIFENLLEDNKDKGAFYTPKEIVQYMSQESIAQYLKTHTEESLHPAIDELIKKRKVPEALQDKNAASKVYQLLDDVKVCDPAIGSGAFPMGILNVLYHSRLLLYGFTNPTKEFSPSSVKRDIIQNNIYGVDIEKGAIDIARLRFWLSIVVDSENPEALPNFDYKFMQGNSLLESFEGINLSRIASRPVGRPSTTAQLVLGIDTHANQRNLHRQTNEYFKATDHKEKNNLRKQINDEVKLLIINSLGTNSRTNAILDSIDISANSKFFLWHTWYKDVFEKGGFDVIIANPPYLKEGRISKTVFEQYKDSPYYMGKMDLWYMFACISLDLLNENGVLCYIATNNWGTNHGAQKMRNKVMKEARICSLIDFGDLMVFESASIQTMVMLFKKDKLTDNYQFDYRRITTGKSTEKDMTILHSRKTSQNIDCFLPTIKRSLLYDNIFTFSKNEELLNMITSCNHILLDENEIAQGIVPNPDIVNARNIKNIPENDIKSYNIQIGDGVFVVSSESIKNVSASEQKYVKPLFEPTSCRRYYLEGTSDDKKILYITKQNYNNDAPGLLSHLWKYRSIMEQRRENQNGRLEYYHLHWPRDERFFTKGEKILVPRKSIKPIFSYYKDEAYVMLSINVIKTDRVDVKYLTGLLNSKLIEFWLKNKGKMQGSNYQLDKEPLQQIPIAQPARDIQHLVSRIVEYIITIKSTKILISNLVSNTLISEYFEKIIDGCVYEIYFPKHMKERNINIIDSALNLITPLDKATNPEEKIKKIWDTFSTIKKTDNEIRNRLDMFTLRSPDILKHIIES